MKLKLSIFATVLLILSGCSTNPETFIEHIDGYWEIQKVTKADGTTHNYTINETIDYFYVSDSLTGFRKKLKPNFSGTYTTSTDAEKLKLTVEDDSLHIYYSTPFSTWKESILYASNKELKIINQNKDVYLYSRFIPINIE